MTQILLTNDANNDLEEIYSYLEDNASIPISDKLLDQFEALFNRLAEMPKMGPVVPELAELGVTQYRHVIDDNYRVIYQAADDAVIVFLIAHTRRDFQDLLMRRLIER